MAIVNVAVRAGIDALVSETGSIQTRPGDGIRITVRIPRCQAAIETPPVSTASDGSAGTYQA